MPSAPSDARDREGNRLGGARADFVASLGRKVQDARELVATLEDDPTSRGARDELRRRLHALGSGARLLRFEAMAGSLAEALTVLERAAQAGALREVDIAFVAQTIDDLPALAWGEPPPRETTRPPEEVAVEESGATALPIAALVVGGEELADALTEDPGLHARPFECERTDDEEVALQLARAYAPDLVVVDADLARASELVEALLDDPLTEPVPIVVVGSFRAPDDAARFVALGVAKALSRPVAPDALRRACDEILDAREGRTMRVTLGEPTLEQLADRLAQEFKRALVDSVDRPARSCRVPLGEGTEVLGALWGAIARVQEVVTQRTNGAVRFGGDAPEGAIALAPWLHHEMGAADRTGGRGRGAAADVRLHGRRVVVADDDPGVTWFISDLLRTAGCEVHEALDGVAALEAAVRVQPELVVSDILMPGLDGFALSRALKRDVALRDTPVILLSWKEDLLQRVRELGASAAAYMRKESDSRAILARVREVLRPRARIEMRIKADGEVRGRLDGLTPRLLLELVGAIRRDARVAVRDASHLYEIEIRGGAPRKVTRTDADGGFVRGEKALASLLGVGSGRFVVASSAEAVRGELSGTLSELLARPLAAARGALSVTTGANTMGVERIKLDEAALDEYLRVTPDPARALVKRIAKGDSPRRMLLGGEVPPSLFEDIVSDLAARGAITAVIGTDGTDLLTPAVDAALEVLQGAPRSMRSLPPNARPSVPAPPPVVRAPVSQRQAATTPPSRASARPSPASTAAAAVTAPPPFETLRLSEPPPPAPALEEGDVVPSSLEDAVMRELSDRSPDPSHARIPTSNPPPIIEPSALRKRSSNPPAGGAVEPTTTSEERLALPSIPPDAIVPGASSSEEILAAPKPPSVGAQEAAAEPAAETTRDDAARDEGARDDAAPDEGWDALESKEGAAVDATEAPPRVEPQTDTEVEGRYEALLLASTQPIIGGSWRPPAEKTQPIAAAKVADTPGEPEAGTQAATGPTSASAPSSGPASVTGAASSRAGKPASTPTPVLTPAPMSTTGRTRPWLSWLIALAAAIAIAYAAFRPGSEPPRAVPAPPTAVNPVPIPPTPAPTGPAVPAPSPANARQLASSDELPPGADVPPGMGLIVVTAPPTARVRIDGTVAGTGPSISVAAAPGMHDVRIEGVGPENRNVVEVRAGKAARVAPPPVLPAP